MDSKQLKKLVKTCRSLGITHYKCDTGEEFTITPEAPTKPIKQKLDSVEKVEALTEDQEQQIKHKIEQVRELYLGTDEDLLDRLFPLPVEEQEQESA
jgi:hypothetical protein